jgi:hypothetical protein
MWPLPPLLKFLRGGLGYKCGEKVKGEKTKERNKKVASGVVVFLLI